VIYQQEARGRFDRRHLKADQVDLYRLASVWPENERSIAFRYGLVQFDANLDFCRY
jgi:hypothetical protein